MLGRDNIDDAALQEYARQVASYFGLPASCEFAERPQLFDFSRRWRSTESIKIISLTQNEGNGEKSVAVSLVGDALIEPFWPEGLGINRGFLSALDAAWAAVQLSQEVKSGEVIGCAAENYKRLRGLSARFSTRTLHPCSAGAYWADPSSRYTAVASPM